MQFSALTSVFRSLDLFKVQKRKRLGVHASMRAMRDRACIQLHRTMVNGNEATGRQNVTLAGARNMARLTMMSS